MSLTNKVAIVTGASSGIGAAIARKLTEEGAQVVIVGRNETKLNNVSEACGKVGKTPLTIIAEVTNDDDLRRIIKSTLDSFEKLHILVNNAGIGDTFSFFDVDAMEHYDKVISTNLRSAVYLTHLAAAHLIESQGNIVNISSIAGQRVLTRGSFAYGTSKAGLDHFTRCLALELAPKGVRVNAISPGPVKTDIIENIGMTKPEADATWEFLKKVSGLGRISDPEEVADMVAHLVSDKGRGITGSNIVIDNGTILLAPMDSANS